MYVVIDAVGILVFISLAWLFSSDRHRIYWRPVALMVMTSLIIAWLLTSFTAGRAAVRAAAQGFRWLVDTAFQGVSFAFENWVGATGVDPEPVNFVTSALLPILLIVPLFDILSYIGLMPWIIKWVGRGLSVVTRQPRFESFFAVEMMFLGNTEALAISKAQLQAISARRNATVAIMSMSCVSAALVGAYVQLVPGEFVLTAIPLNCINALLVASILYPVPVSEEEDTIVTVGGADGGGHEVDAEAVARYEALPLRRRLVTRRPDAPEREPFFSFLGDSVLEAGKVILIVLANVIAFVALAALIDRLLALVSPGLSLEAILGVALFPLAWLLGLEPSTAYDMSQLMGLKLVTNEFVVMGQVTSSIGGLRPLPGRSHGLPHLLRQLLDCRNGRRMLQGAGGRGAESHRGAQRVADDALGRPRLAALSGDGRALRMVTTRAVRAECRIPTHGVVTPLPCPFLRRRDRDILTLRSDIRIPSGRPYPRTAQGRQRRSSVSRVVGLLVRVADDLQRAAPRRARVDKAVALAGLHRGQWPWLG